MKKCEKNRKKGGYFLQFFSIFSKKGFTIAELVVVVLVVGFLGTLSFRTYLDMVHRQELDNALNRVVEIIKTARNDALTSRTVYLGDPAIATIPPEGYGVYLTKTPAEDEGSQVIAFANTSIADEKASQFDADDQVLESLRLPSSVVFDRLAKLTPSDTLDDPEAGEDLGAEAIILFRPPLAQVFISNNGDPAVSANNVDTLSIRLLQRDEPSRKKVITIDQVAGTPALHL